MNPFHLPTQCNDPIFEFDRRDLLAQILNRPLDREAIFWMFKVAQTIFPLDRFRCRYLKEFVAARTDIAEDRRIAIGIETDLGNCARDIIRNFGQASFTKLEIEERLLQFLGVSLSFLMKTGILAQRL